MSFVRRPQSVFVRRALFQVHLWCGVALAAYVAVVGATGAAVVFRPELQASAYPQFFTVERLSGQKDVEAPAILDAIQSEYPDYRLVGIDWPTYRRQTFLVYLSKGRDSRTVFIHPLTARVIGELKDESWTRVLQDLHFNLLAGRPGLVANGIGAICLLVMCLTGLVIWWPGINRWRQSLTVDFRKGWKRINWELHGAVGFWLVLLLMMWATTGIYFVWSQPFRRVVSAIAPLTVVRAPESNRALEGRQPVPKAPALIDVARRLTPGAKLARLIPPSGPKGTYLVILARNVHGDFDTSDEVSIYFDQYNGGVLQVRDQRQRSIGDTVMAWVGPLHVGSFGGAGVSGTIVKVIWTVLALSFPLLALTGLVMWWNRVLSERWSRGLVTRARPVRPVP